LRKAAEQGNAEAQYDFGVLSANGKGGVPKDSAEALKWFHKAAEQGHAQAQFKLAAPYAFGFGVPKDNAKAITWCRKAAEQGHAEAQNYLAYLYINNFSGMGKDAAEAMKWYRKAAEQGYAEAQLNLAEMYDNGEEGVPEDDAEAVKWYRKAAEQGHAPATEFLGQMYRYGRGVPEDAVAAYAWYSVGAAQRNQYRKNRDSFKRSLTPSQVEKGEAMAHEIMEQIQMLFRKAAEQGHAEAQIKLGNCYYRGIGVANDGVTAYAWRSVAASSGHDFARALCDATKGELTPSQVEKGEAMAREISERIEKRKAAERV